MRQIKTENPSSLDSASLNRPRLWLLYQPSSGLTCGIVELVKKMVRHEGFEASSVNMGAREIGQRMKVIIVSDKARYFNTLVLGPKGLLVAAALCLVTAIVSAVAWRHYTQADTRLADFAEVMKETSSFKLPRSTPFRPP